MAELSLATFIDALGGPVPASATLTATASRARVDGESVTAPASLVVELDGDTLTVDLEATGANWYWTLSLEVGGAWSIVRTVAMPAASVDWGDLVDIDPATMLPDPGAVPAWEAAAAVVTAAMRTAEEASRSALESASSALDSAASANLDARSASADADAASASASTAGVAATTALGVVAGVTSDAQSAMDSRLAAAGFATSASDSATVATARAGEAANSATAAGTAKTAAEAAANLALAGQFAGADVGTADLNTITTPGMRKQGTSSNATLAMNYPYAGVTGVLEVLNVGAGSTALIQRFTSHSGGSGNFLRGIYQRRLLSGAWSSWLFIPIQRVDQTAGRAIYTWDDVNNREQLTYGDTGWRDVRELLVNGWTATVFNIRRIGLNIHVLIVGLAGGGTSLVLSMPGGFSVGSGIGVSGIRLLDTPIDGGNVSLGTGGSLTATTGVTIAPGQGRIVSYATIVPWPTALPGVAVGSIPA